MKLRHPTVPRMKLICEVIAGIKTNTDGGKTCLAQTIEVECERVRRKTESLGDRTGPHYVRTDLDKQPKHDKRFSYARAAKATNADAFFIIRRI